MPKSLKLIRSLVIKLRKLCGKVDWSLLVFLIFFLNVKSWVKIVALIFIYLVQPNFRFGFKLSNSRLPLFYLYITGIAIFNWIITQSFLNLDDNFALLIGIMMWAACVLAVHQLKHSVDNTDTTIIYNTVISFFILNALFSLGNYALIIWETGVLNPYRYQGDYQKYFIRTGDYIKGITLDTSTTNAVINAFGVILFLTKKNWGMLFVCMLILILTVSNLVNIMMLGVFAFMFLYRSDQVQKSFLVICIALGAIFMVKISPENYRYVRENLVKIRNNDKLKNGASPKHTDLAVRDSTLEEKRIAIARSYLDSVYISNLKLSLNRQDISAKDIPAESIKPQLDTVDLNVPIFQSRNVTTSQQENLIRFINLHKESLPLSGNQNQEVKVPGKIIALQQTLQYFGSHKEKIPTGNGIGSFSSKLAFRTTGLGLGGNYPLELASINPAFLSNHLDIYLFFFTKNIGFHSLVNTPNSVYIQLLSEYGVIGLSIFVVFYLGFFSKHYQSLTYGIPLLLFITGVFFMDYWFEQLSIIILFELLLMLDLKETSKLKEMNPS